MSKKNNQQTRARMHAARVEREREEAAKRSAKLDKKEQRRAEAAAHGVAAPKSLKRKGKKGVRIRKNVVVRGVKVTDAESKRRVKEILAAEEAMKDLMMDMEGEGAQQAQQAAEGEVRMKEGRRPGHGKARATGSRVRVKAKERKEKKKAAKPAGMALG